MKKKKQTENPKRGRPKKIVSEPRQKVKAKKKTAGRPSGPVKKIEQLTKPKRGRPRKNSVPADGPTVILLKQREAARESQKTHFAREVGLNDKSKKKIQDKDFIPDPIPPAAEAVLKSYALVDALIERSRSKKPGKLNDVLLAMIYQRKSQGNFDCAVYDSLGIRADTWITWKRRGEADEKAGADTIYRKFIDVLRIAEAESEANLVNTIRISGFKSWQACAWLLERRWRDRWGATKEGQNFLEVLRAASEASEETAVRELIIEKMNSLIDSLGLDPASAELLKRRADDQLDEKLDEQKKEKAG